MDKSPLLTNGEPTPKIAIRFHLADAQNTLMAQPKVPSNFQGAMGNLLN